MTNTSDNTSMHDPSPEFRERLEWEIVSTFRREQRLDDKRHRTIRRMRAAAVILVSIAIGATAGFAPAQIRENTRRDSLLQSARGDMELAMVRLELARASLADVRRKMDAGVLGESSLASALAELRTMEARVMRAKLDTEEIAATSEPPRDELNAPLARGRDFVKERLQLDLMAAQQRLTSAEESLAAAERRIRVGAAMSSSSIDAQEDMARARAALIGLAAKLRLREEFVSKGTPVQELQRRLDDQQLMAEAEAGTRLLALERERLAGLEKQLSVGMIDEVEVMKARVAVREREIELRRLSQRLRERR